jgi:hypothetical protein
MIQLLIQLLVPALHSHISIPPAIADVLDTKSKMSLTYLLPNVTILYTKKLIYFNYQLPGLVIIVDSPVKNTANLGNITFSRALS